MTLCQERNLTMRKSTRRLTVLAAAVLPMVTLTTAALADDDKTYPGAMCRSINNVEPPVLKPDNGALTNISDGPQTWICPAVRVRMDDEELEYARITVQENGKEPVRCTFEARTYLGEGSVTSGTTPKRESKTLTLSPLTEAVVYEGGKGETGALIGNPHKHGYYFFRCEVPGKVDPITRAERGLSGVITYKVTEAD
jgi:hypothetical protein